jgi:hypothetical protein
MQLEPALGTAADRLGERLQYHTALRAAGNGACPGHLHWPGTEGIFLNRPLRGLLFLVLFVAAILVSVLAILPV